MERERKREKGNGLNRVALRFLRVKTWEKKKKEAESSVHTKKYQDIEIKTANTQNVDTD